MSTGFHPSSAVARRPALWLLVLTLAAVAALAAPGGALAQTSVTAPIAALNNSGVTGSALLAADGDASTATLTLIGLPAGASAQVNLHAGTCALPSASAVRLLTLTAGADGRATAGGRVAVGAGSMTLADLADGQHILMVLSGGQPVACGAIPTPAVNAGPAAVMLAEGQRHQVMQFNPGAALQKRIFADGFVPNSGEFSVTLEATTFAAQRAEHLRTGAVRVYFARTGDWGNVRYYQRGGNLDALGRFLLTEAENRQAIQFNPGAALQKRIFTDGFVPNSGEFSLQVGGAAYTGQRAEHLGTGRVRVYYAITGQWGNVQLVESTPGNLPPPGPAVVISPTSGPTGAQVQVSASGLPFNSGVTLWGGPVGSEGTQLAEAVTNAEGRATFTVRVQGAAGTRWVFGVAAAGGNVHAESAEFTFTG